LSSTEIAAIVTDRNATSMSRNARIMTNAMTGRIAFCICALKSWENARFPPM
jgi:hypothetical protein